MTPADFRRKAHLKNKEMRDVLLNQFLNEDLVRMDGGKMQATTFLEFVEALHVRKEFPLPENHLAVAHQSEPTGGLRDPYTTGSPVRGIKRRLLHTGLSA